jgi:hypothetical protein
MKRLKLLALMACAIMLGNQTSSAQELLFTELFDITSSDTGEGTWISMSEIPRYSDWSFNNCYGITTGNDGYYMQVGSKTAIGTATSRPLGVYGNVILFICTTSIEGNATSYYVYVEGSNDKKTYKVAQSGESRTSAILIKNCTPSTKFCIENKETKRFFVKSIKAVSIGNSLFYESFDSMLGRNVDHSEFYPFQEHEATKDLCDNKTVTTISNVWQSEGNIYFYDSSSSYTIKPAIVSSTTDILLSFKIAHLDNNNEIEIACNDATLSAINSTNISSTASSRKLTNLQTPVKTWEKYFIVIKGMTNATTITFTGSKMSLDEIMLFPLPTGLDQSIDNSAYIMMYYGQEQDVTLQRTLTANIWCPLCLPFNITPEQMSTATGANCQLCTLDNVTEGLFHFTDVQANGTVTAGTPFLVKTDAQVVNPTFSGVTINNTPAQTKPSADSDYQFVGIYSPFNMNTDGTHLFLGIDGNLYQPGTGSGENRLGGMRAYFVRPLNAQNQARVLIDSGSNGIVNTEAAEMEAITPIFDLQGRRMASENHLNKGLYVRNGRKYLMK